MGVFGFKTIVNFSCLALVLGILGCGLNEPSSEPDSRPYPKEHSHLGPSGDSGNTPGWRGTPASRIHEGLLSEWAFRFDCYFTIEEQCPKGKPSRVLGVHLAEALTRASMLKLAAVQHRQNERRSS